mmetsp:Transcript_13316/g.21812  ORF Transcript_13316/g.21812 Transcript_13316/m.21812 type:complete len:254 (-) Transcript_13316:55-816(-)|eukprot:CAMPEP_0114422772 /NCGR_PEP_ID=MMETSP0103-20121206/5788_1 /TAXON_ID=37642 ORGANISM="Paraphysomonas imperforata, Strain PA2" /NCGR_SAMPLE_ID=MMETSP0103 /ASSEMBLY_ACC=CAM_ASM_000201 /LENGTH=253 /DNA_ID=CAMNT_0001591379 /DNA_START=60 /DNA_END=821 /DNA_ORIENTATION=+
MAKGKYCASRKCKLSVSKGGLYCSRHQRGALDSKKTKANIKKKKTCKISDVDPIYEYEMSESLKEETRNLRNYFHPTLRSTRFRYSDDFSDRPEVKAKVYAFSQMVFDFLKNLPGSVLRGSKADKYEIFDWVFNHAPPRSRKAGTTHVDMLYHQSHKAYTVWMPIDEVTEENGCVTMFLKSQGTPIDYHNPNQDSKFEKRIVTGNLGKIVVFDGRIHHRSEANKTDNMRTIALFCLKKKGFRVQGESGKEFVV